MQVGDVADLAAGLEGVRRTTSGGLARWRFHGVPNRFRKHMMVVADLAAADAGVIEDALVAAWELQRIAD